MIIKEVQTKSILTKSNLPVSEYSVNPYVGCTHACRDCNCREVDASIKTYASEKGLKYVRDDDSMKNAFEEPPVIVNYFYHEEIKKSARKIL